MNVEKPEIKREKVEFTKHYEPVVEALTSRGLLLAAYDSDQKPNVMTIGWGAMGNIWSQPLWIVLVRPSRYTYQCIEHSQCFTVNVPGEDLSMACATCGSKSGRDTDKFRAAGLTAQKASGVLAPVVAQCPVVYECQVVHSNDVAPAKLTSEILSGTYTNGDYHRIYYGKIVSSWAAPNAADLLR